jgi:bifunctional NMN adenylyltransferase/nudix hydrolase
MAVLKVGVIIGRFQVPELHAGHLKLFTTVADQSDRVVVLLGISPIDGHTAENPLTFDQRQHIVLASLASVTPLVRAGAPVILPLADCRTNEEWSGQIDALLHAAYPNDDLTLYGGRDSFVDAYRGKLRVEHIVAIPAIPVAGTINRAAIKETNSPDFYRGQIYALQRQHPRVHCTVDVAFVRNSESNITDTLLIQRVDSGQWCFPGGFVDPTDLSIESAAKREMMEELGLTTETVLEHIGSFRIDDFRYRGSRDKIITTFFMAHYAWGMPVLNYAEVQDYAWVPLQLQVYPALAPHHQPLWQALFQFYSVKLAVQLNG